MRELFGTTPCGDSAFLYTIACGSMKAVLSDFGATLVRLYVPDSSSIVADVVLGFDSPAAYAASGTFFGATVGRNSNRVGNASFTLGGEVCQLDPNDNGKNNLHSGFNPYKNRLWRVISHTDHSITFSLYSPHGDQGFPGNADISVTYTLDGESLHVSYEAISDRDTVFNMTNHSYFNLAGHDDPNRAMEQVLSMPARFYTVADAESIPTGENRSVVNTPMDFRSPKPIGRDIDEDYEALNLQGGYDHNYEVFCNPCAQLSDPHSGRSMAVYTDCPGVQLYAGNFLQGEQGKDGVCYPKRSGICLETQFYPDSMNHPQWPQPVVKAGQKYKSKTTYRFIW